MDGSAYTVRNLRELEDSAPRFGLGDTLEARFATAALECERVGLSYQRVAPNQRIPFGHRHVGQEEVYVLVAGGGRMKLGDQVVELRAWDAVRVSPGTMRGFEAGPDGAEILAFGGPRDSREAPNDAEMEPGWWSDS
jgi:mannose-6-phosphate isomerase-like protein (cupin superfamily)